MDIGWEEEALCCVCIDLLDDPVILDCGHTVCMKCAAKVHEFDGMRNSAASLSPDDSFLRCPQCRGETKLPGKGGVESLKRNYTLKNVVEKLKEEKLRQQKESATCGNCEERPARYECEDCCFPLCEDCKSNQHSKGGYKTHRIHPVGSLSRSKPKLCPAHSKDLDLFDTSTNELLCIYCLQLSYTNKSHLKSVVPLSDAVASAKEQLSVSMAAMQGKASELEAKVGALREKEAPQIAAQAKEIRSTLDEYFSSLRGAIDATETKLRGELDCVTSAKMADLEAEVERLNSLNGHMTEARDKFATMIATAKDSSLIKAKDMMLDRVRALTESAETVYLALESDRQVNVSLHLQEPAQETVSRISSAALTAEKAAKRKKQKSAPASVSLDAFGTAAKLARLSSGAGGAPGVPRRKSASDLPPSAAAMQLQIEPEARPAVLETPPPAKRLKTAPLSGKTDASSSSGSRLSLRI
ncbi:hypothetical protein DIPPA_19548 [Diplonema papillatum]|nr:hypothetical protein DIPPA_19548 [Diplonema papillatum]